MGRESSGCFRNGNHAFEFPRFRRWGAKTSDANTALKAANLAGVNIPDVDRAVDQAMKHFERVKGVNGGYRYRSANEKNSLTGVGILCNVIWKGDRAALRKGIDWLLATAAKQGGVKFAFG